MSTVVLIVGMALIGFALPRHKVIANAAVVLNGSPEELFDCYNSREGQQLVWTRAWERFNGKGHPMSIVDLGGPDSGTGTKLGYYPGGEQSGGLRAFFNSIAQGDGQIVESEPNQRIVIDIDFGFVRTRRVNTFEETGDNRTRVTWSETLTASNPFSRWMLVVAGDSQTAGFEKVLLALEDVTAEKACR